MQYVLGSSLHENNTNHLLFGQYHASVNWISFVSMQINPQNEIIMGFVKIGNGLHKLRKLDPWKDNHLFHGWAGG